MVYHFSRREWDEAIRYIEKMREDDPNDPYLDADIAYIYATKGRIKESVELIDKLNRVIPETSRTKYSLIAFVYSAFDLDQCFKWLDRAYEAREVFYGWFRNYPIFENVRQDPRFNELLKKADLL